MPKVKVCLRQIDFKKLGKDYNIVIFTELWCLAAICRCIYKRWSEATPQF
jgi:hypothetical protein